MDTAQILGGFVWAAVAVGYAASVWKLGHASRGATWPKAPERGTRSRSSRAIHHTTEDRMDLLYLGLGVGFFALSWAFIIACERLG